MFGIQAMLTGLITIASIYVIPKSESTPTTNHTRGLVKEIDWIGGILITVSLFVLLFALAEGNMVGWKRPWLPSLIVVSMLIVAIFVTWQFHLEKKGIRAPLIKISLFRNIRFSMIMIADCLFCASFNNCLVFATYFFQDYLGLSPLQTMLRFIPTGVIGLLSPMVVASLLGKVPTIALFIAGHLFLAASSILFGISLPEDVSFFVWEFWAMMLFAFGMNIFWPCLAIFMSNALPKDDQAVAGALMYVFNQLGRAFGLSISTAVQIAVSGSASRAIRPGDKAFLKGIRAASWLDVGFAAASLVLASVAFWRMEYVQKT